MLGFGRTSSTNAGDDPKDCREANRKALAMLCGNRDLATVVLVMADRDVERQTFAYTGSGTTWCDRPKRRRPLRDPLPHPCETHRRVRRHRRPAEEAPS
jgi:hypothetical protein